MKAQISLEYLLVFVLMLFLLLPALAFFTQEFGTTTDRLRENQILSFANTVISTTEQVYYTGSPASKRVSGRLPEGVESIRVEDGGDADELIIAFQTNEGLVTTAVSTTIDLQLLSLPTDTNDGLRTVFIEAYTTMKEGNTQPLAVLTFNGRCPASTQFDFNQDNEVNCDDVALAGASCDLSQMPQRPQNTWNENNIWESCYALDYSGDCIVDQEDFVLLASRTPQGSCPMLSVVGGDCSSSGCISTAFCNPSDVCQAKAEVGGGCSAPNECVSGTCDSGVCKSDIGGLCSATTECVSGSECVIGVCEVLRAVGAFCSVGEQCVTGVCEGNSCVVAAGNACSGMSMNECAAGSSCIGGFCSIAVGDNCSASNECVSGSSCDIVDGAGVCRLPLGGTCSLDNECVSGLCDIMDGADVGVCKSAIGGSCSADSQCLSGECESGTCEYRIVTFAGGGSPTDGLGDNLAATSAILDHPFDVFVNGSEVFIADSGNDRVRRVDASGIISTVVGDGTRCAYSVNNPDPNNDEDCGDGGLAINAQLGQVRGVFVNGSELFIAGSGNHRVRLVADDGIIDTFAGSGTVSGLDGDFDGDGGLATMARLDFVSQVFVNGSEVFIADSGNHRVRLVDDDGIIDTFAGSGPGGIDNGDDSGDGGVATSARLNFPSDVFVNGSEVFIADANNARVRRVDSSRIISTVVGIGAAGSSGYGVFVNGSDVFIVDRNNHRVRRVDSSGVISTIAGTGSRGFGGDNGPARSAQLNFPSGVSVNGSDIFIADLFNHRIRKLCANASNCT